MDKVPDSLLGIFSLKYIRQQGWETPLTGNLEFCFNAICMLSFFLLFLFYLLQVALSLFTAKSDEEI